MALDYSAFYILSSLYPEEITFLDSPDPFQFLIMVMLSAQTTDKRVMEVSPHLFAKYPDAHSLANADVSTVEEIIKPLGFYKVKAKNIIATSKEIVRLGCIPSTMDQLIKLPGVGRKTSSCYIGHVLGQGAIIVDTHFKRVAYRLGYTDSKDPDKIEEEIKRTLPEKDWYRASMVLNAFGRDICHAKNSECARCPVASYCKRR